MLLDLLDSAWQDWLVQLQADLAEAVDTSAPLAVRADQLAAAVAASLACRAKPAGPIYRTACL